MTAEREAERGDTLVPTRRDLRARVVHGVHRVPVAAHAAVFATVAVIVYVNSPTAIGETLFQLIAWGSVAMIVVGTRRHRARSAAWTLIALGFASFAAGDLLFTIYEDVLHETPFPSYADVLYLAGYPLLASGLAMLVRRSRSVFGHAALIDAGILVVPVAVAAWIYLIDPAASGEGLTFVERSVSAAYPVFDLVCLAVLVRLMIGFAGARTKGQHSLTLFIVGFVVMLGADGWFLVVTLQGDSDVPPLLNAAYLLPYIGLAAAAAHPSIRLIGAPVTTRWVTLSRRRLGVLATAALVTPILLGVRWATHEDLAVPLIVAGTIISFLLVVARMSGLVMELEASRSALEFEATHDMLTGLPNRQEFNRRLTRSLATGGAGALLFIDLDHFKAINDSCGHQVGDEVLIEVAARLRHVVRVEDTPGRLAGDEFVVLTETADPNAVLLMAERLLRELELTRTANGTVLRVTASIGVVHWPKGTQPREAAELLNAADRAMYDAKVECGNRLAVRSAL